MTQLSHISAVDALLKKKPKTKRGIETLDRLCAAAEELFSEKNYYSTSVSEIVTRTGISIGAFYMYFNDKLSIYKYIVLQYGRKLRKYIAMRLSEMDLTTRHEIEREGLKLFFTFCIENPATFVLVWQSLFVAPELFINYYDEFGKQYEKQLGLAVRTGEVRHVNNMEAATYMLMGSSNFLACKYITFGPPVALSDKQIYRIVDDMMDIFDNGLFIYND